MQGLASKAALKVRGLSKAYRGNKILKGVDLDIEAGELAVVIGRSGCGKSTLLRCLMGLEGFDEGRVTFGEYDSQKDVRALRSNFGMVFQSFNLFGHWSVLDNIAKAPTLVKKIPRVDAEKQARELLEMVGLSTHVHHYPIQLSGGQQQRVAIARALAMQPQIMLYDEPTSALDPWLVDEVFQVMRKIHQGHMTQIVVTHEMRFMREVAQKVIFMDQGEVVEVGPPSQVFKAPRDRRTEQYLSKVVHP